MSNLLLIGHHFIPARNILQRVVKLIPLVSPRTLERNDQQFWISQFSGLAAETVSLSLECGDTASDFLQTLELGRGILASLQLEIRSDISSLREAHQDLASRFDIIRDILDRPQESPQQLI